METQTIPIQISCPIHPSDYIQRINIEANSTQHLYCVECLLQQADPTSSPNFKGFQDFIDIAEIFYNQNKITVSGPSEIKPEYQELLSHQNEKLEQLTVHIQEEKKRIEIIFDTLSQDFLKIINEKRNRYIDKLDQQLFKLNYWYIYFDKQIKKTYPTQEDILTLFPSRESLDNQLHTIVDYTHLMAFVRNIKDDLNEHKLGLTLGDENSQESRKSYLEGISKELATVENLKPRLESEQELVAIKATLKKPFEDTIEKMLRLDDPIPDVVLASNYESSILNAEQFKLLKQWLPQRSKFNPKLLYRGIRDGMDPKTFHNLCDGKGPTVSIIKCKFKNSSKTSIIGGFVEKSWSKSSHYMP